LKNFRNIPVYIVLLFSLLPGFYLSFSVLQSPWTLFRIARIELSLPSNNIATYASSAAAYRPEHLGEVFLDTAILLFSQWPGDWVSLLPLGSLLSVIFYYTITLKISGSRIIASAMAIFVGWYYPRLVSQYSIETYVWTNSLFIGFLLVFWEWLSESKVLYSSSIIFFFIITFLFYQTTPIWIIIALISAISMISIKKLGNSGDRKNVSWALPLFCIVFYLAFDTVIYGDFIARITSEATHENLLESLTSKIIFPLFQNTNVSLPAYHTLVPNSPIATTSTLFSWLIMVIPVVFWLMAKLFTTWRRKNFFDLVNTREDIFIWSMIFVASGHAIGYSNYGSVSLRVVPLTFPLLLCIIPKNIDLPYAKQISYFLTLSLTLTATIGFWGYSITFKPDLHDVEIGYAADLIPDKSNILADAGLYGALNLKAAINQKKFELKWPESKKYDALIKGQDIRDFSVDNIVIDKSNKPLTTLSWVFLDPWMLYINQIDQNSYLNKVYDSSYISTFQSKFIPLPFDQNIFIMKLPGPGNFSTLFLRLAFVLFVVIGLPGLLIVTTLRDLGLLEINDPFHLISMAVLISIGIISIIGYTVNFTHLGINSYFLIVASIVISLMIIQLKVRKSKEKPIIGFSIDLILLFLLVLTWAFISTRIAILRNNIDDNFNEFFVTQSINSPSAITIYIVNHSNTRNEYALVMNETINPSITLDRFSISSSDVYRREIDISKYKGQILNLWLLCKNEILNLRINFEK
jgi:hypothetical protein